MKKNVQGSTLIEVVVALAITVIAVGIMTTSVTASGRIIQRAKEYSNSSSNSFNGIINTEGNNNSYEDIPLNKTYSLGGITINPDGVVKKVTNGSVSLISFIPDNDDYNNNGKYYIPGTTTQVNVIHPEYEDAGNHYKLHYQEGTTIMYDGIYYYVNKNININHYDINSDPYDVIITNIDKLIKFTGVNYTTLSEDIQIGDTISNGDTYYVITSTNPNYKTRKIT